MEKIISTLPKGTMIIYNKGTYGPLQARLTNQNAFGYQGIVLSLHKEDGRFYNIHVGGDVIFDLNSMVEVVKEPKSRLPPWF